MSFLSHLNLLPRFPKLLALLLVLLHSLASPFPLFTNTTPTIPSPPTILCFTSLNRSIPVNRQTCAPLLIDLSTSSTTNDPQTFHGGTSPYVFRNRYTSCTVTLRAANPHAVVALTMKQIAGMGTRVLERCGPWERGGGTAVRQEQQQEEEEEGDVQIWEEEEDGSKEWWMEIGAERAVEVEPLPRNVSQHLR